MGGLLHSDKQGGGVYSAQLHQGSRFSVPLSGHSL